MALYGRVRNTRVLVVSLVMISLLTITVDYRGGQHGPFEVAGRAVYTVVAAVQAGVAAGLHPSGGFHRGVGPVGTPPSPNEALVAGGRVPRGPVGGDTSPVSGTRQRVY